MQHHPTHLLYPLTTALALASALAAPAPALADDFRFLQTGYADDAVVRGRFSGTDLDGDGWLVAGELTDFRLRFTGNHAVAAFTHGLAHLTDFSFGAAVGTFVGDDSLALYFSSLAVQGERITAFGTFAWPLDFAAGHVMELPSFVISGTADGMQVAAVPEPGTAALWLAGLASVASLSRRRRAAAAAV